MPIFPIDWVAGYFVNRYRIGTHVVTNTRALGTLVRSNGLRFIVTIQVSQKNSDVGTTIFGHRQDQLRPRFGTGIRTRVLQIQQVGKFYGHHDIRIAIPVNIRDCCIFGSGSLRQGNGVPRRGIRRAKGQSNMARSIRNKAVCN